ncbi:hypothetical protein [Actinomadura rudentiformis]|uniref:Uncharacterized protein n=1 Tax=Actinomadura rudentiformis TaxID=359158 RepID=A0A6H9YUM6_9ACTN|nr:hypothetical protein [Actinomadura rudentiformis]KAB2350749.1 hypothetical protein F8566_07130 [Actinomadura rudentiformis]
MTYELVIWHEDAPVDREQAATAFEQATPHPAVAAFAKEFGGRFPDVEMSAEHERFARVRMDPERADEVSAQVYALARALGLTCYDPYRRLVHNLGPTGAYEGMQLHTGDGVQVVDPDLGLVRDVLERLSDQNPFAALVVFGEHFVQAAPEPGGYELEYKDSRQNKLHRTHVTDLAVVQRAFDEYARGDRAFLDRHAWEG